MVHHCIVFAGEAAYLDDIAALPNETFGAFVLSEYANAKIKSINATEALVSIAHSKC